MDPNAIRSKIGSVTLVNDIKTFAVDEGIKTISLKLISGTVTYAGSENLVTDSGAYLKSKSKVLDGSGFEISCDNPVDEFVVDASAGSVIIAFIKG